jgi:hypothetical protein
MSLKYKSPRKATPLRIEKAVLAKSRRRCTLCFGLKGDETEKLGQIAHLDGNRSNNSESNLAWMCLDHHSLFDSTTKQHKNYTISEVKEYRRLLYKVLHSAPQRSSRRARRSTSKPKQAERSGKVTNSPVASGTNIAQTINPPTLNLSLPTPTSGTPGREQYDEWRELIDEIHESIEQMGWAFVDAVAHKADDERCDYQAGIRRGNRVLGTRILIADAIKKSGLKQDWDQLVQYAHSGRGPRDRWQQGAPTMGGFDKKAREFQEKLMRIAREDMRANAFVLPEETGRPLIIPLRYGAAPTSAGKHLMGYHGLVVANHGEPAYDVSVLTSEIPIGTSKLQLEGIRPTLTKTDGDAFFRAGILESPRHGIMGSGLFDEMRRHHVAEIIVELIYKDAENRWYKTVGKIERNVSEPGGLSVRYIRREQTEQPKEGHANIGYSVLRPSNAAAAITVEHSVSRMIDRESGEEHFEGHRPVTHRNPGLEIVFGGDSKPYFENQPTLVLPGGRVYERRYRVGVQNTTGEMISAKVVLEDCQPSEHHGIHLGHALQVMSHPGPGTGEVSVSPSDKPTAFFDVVYDETLEGKLRDDGFGLCYTAPVRLFAIPRGTYHLTLRVEGGGMQSRKKFKIFQDPASQMLTMREVT